jgi:predicted RNase H-like nuclease (RuvC/YqgF family)
VGYIVGFQTASPRVGVATTSGRAYYRISNLLKRINIPFTDIVLPESNGGDEESCFNSYFLEQEFGVIITTRKERLYFRGNRVICEEDLGDDPGVAKVKLISTLYPPKKEDRFVVGVDPGERTGVAAFMNHREVESSVCSSIEEALSRVVVLMNNAPEIRKTVKIGCGNPLLAKNMARALNARLVNPVEIHLVNEDGTSILRKKGRFSEGTRDQRAAKLIAFRGRD